MNKTNRKFQAGDYLRTTYLGKAKDQVFILVEPVEGYGDESGGQWWIRRHYQQFTGRTGLSFIRVNNCPRVSPAQLKQWKIK